MREVARKVVAIHEHIADARSDYYHNAVNQLLSRYDVIGIGKWRGNGKAPGEGEAKRAQTRKDYDHAISSFASILKYKAEGCGKQVFDVPEHGTTKTCTCGATTGPSGLAGLSVREWTCSACGTSHNRDFHAAAEIARRAQEMAAASAGGVASPVKAGRKKGRSTPKVQTKVMSQDIGVPVIDQTLSARKDISVEYCERRSDVSEAVYRASGIKPCSRET
jgi:transposase